MPVPVAGEPDRRHHDRDDRRHRGVAEAERTDRREEQEDDDEPPADRERRDGARADEAGAVLDPPVAAAPVGRPPALFEDDQYQPAGTAPDSLNWPMAAWFRNRTFSSPLVGTRQSWRL